MSPENNPEPGSQEYIEMRLNSIRIDRNLRIALFLKEHSWKMQRHERELRLGIEKTTITQEEYNSIDKYIQALCDLPQTITDLDNFSWPVPPYEIVSLRPGTEIEPW